MQQSLEFILWADRHPEDKKRIMEALSSLGEIEIVVDRHRLSFNPSSRIVMVDKASKDVPWACKIAKCKMTYELLTRLLNGERSDLDGFEWIID